MEQTKTAGLTTEEALDILHKDILELLDQNYKNKVNENFLRKTINIFRNKSRDVPLGLFSVFFTLICVLFLFMTSYFIEGIFLFGLLAFNLYIIYRENFLKETELHRKVRKILREIEMAKSLCKDWTAGNYPHLCSPISPCITLNWTWRSGEILNLPWSLLVRGDHIILRPGQVSPGSCKQIGSDNPRSFKLGETYGLTHPLEPPLRPVARSPLPDLICILESTPYLENLKTILNQFNDRPSTIHNQQRHLLVTKCIQQYIFLIVFMLHILFGTLRFFGFYIKGKFVQTWPEIFFLNTVTALLPLLPLIFPILWYAVNLWGTARLETLLTIPQPLMPIEKAKSFQEDLDLDTPTFDLDLPKIPRREVFVHWIKFIQGRSELLPRSANIVQVLGSITALCCVDKKGILSWPNPTAEKVFFLRDSSETSSHENSSESSFESDNTNPRNEKVGGGAVAEVLDLTHDQHSPFKLEFDDAEWKNHLNSLKPLGLAILTNTCSEKTHFSYAKFCGHISATAMNDNDLVPVTNRCAFVENSLISFMHGRCLCELSRQIGFTPQAKNVFSLEGQISNYRHLQPDVVKRDIRFAKSLQLASKVKVPFPHSLSVVMRETYSGTLQLMTQGTADIILDLCDDYWNGKDLKPLRTEERKRVQDFYQRNALTAYCTAFSYRPLRKKIQGLLAGSQEDDFDHDSDVAYLELPPETKYKMVHVAKDQCDFEGHSTLAHSISTDSLLFTDNKEEQSVNQPNDCFEMQCHQIFIAMVTMQYQAQTDIIQLIERLERACIRFVHFSKENELRSRVFSEKMGLESGWNCHISLLTDEDNLSNASPKASHNPENRSHLGHEDEKHDGKEFHRLLPTNFLESSKTLSSSAPCAISESGANPHSSPPHSEEEKDYESDSLLNQHRTSNDSAMDMCHTDNMHSLSCLTDSTEQSAQIPIYMSNRAKLPRGIKNMVHHIENVDNVPLLVSLFTDCSPEATKEMLAIMQRYGEIVVCLGSSASNSNSEIFLQADCSIAMEPLYPQVCQNFPAYTESNIYNNKQSLNKSVSRTNLLMKLPRKAVTISPIYISRMLNSLACSISVCRDDPISMVSLIDLSRRFSTGLWNFVQFWVCCAVTFTILNTLCTCICLPPMLTPPMLIYLMCFFTCSLSLSLVRIEQDALTMHRATGKKQTTINSRFFVFILWSYGCKFVPVMLILFFTYCITLSHPFEIFEMEEKNFEMDLQMARNFIFFGVVLHLIVVSESFVHRDYSVWRKNPFTNVCWFTTVVLLLILHIVILIIQVSTSDYNMLAMDRIWPILAFLITTIIFTFVVVEFCKWQEIKSNLRYQRRARLDFGTKLGMNSPF